MLECPVCGFIHFAPDGVEECPQCFSWAIHQGVTYADIPA